MKAKLEAENGPLEGTVYRIGGTGSLTIGRASSADLSIPDKAVSRSHCRLEHEDSFWWLIDDDSHNGTLVNGKPIAKAMLFGGDRIEIGHQTFRFVLTEEEPQQ
ncbi:MAG: FHA domain-containing protein [Planctomycetota bacterium]